MSDLDAWHANEEQFTREAIGDTNKTVEGEGEGEENSLPGLMIKIKNQNVEKPMAWPVFRNYYVMRFHNPMAEVSRIVPPKKNNEANSVRHWYPVGLKRISCTSKTLLPLLCKY